ncbi:hypothetical protein [Arsenicicoccus dermatophilus]|uniref:hypothetical protein n=1 Tax=Arsenicicoccus dermatophilus TaxID=1076331 RepID=UPI0039175FA2
MFNYLASRAVALAAVVPGLKPADPAGKASLNLPGIFAIAGLAITVIGVVIGIMIMSQSGKGNVKHAGNQAGHFGIGLLVCAAAVIIGGATALSVFGGFVDSVIQR